MSNSILHKKITLIIIGLLIITPTLLFISEKNNVTYNLRKPKQAYSKAKNNYIKKYGLKENLLKGYLNFKLDLLKDNPLPFQIIKGKKEWLFLGNSYENSFDNAFGNNQFNQEELTLITTNLNKIKAYLDSKNIDFHLVIAPDKNQIYSEFLPYQLKKNKTKCAILLDKLKKETSINAFSLHTTLLNNKNKETLYYKTDSHWNTYGAFVGYKEIISKLNTTKNIITETLDNYLITKTKDYTGDLSVIIQSKNKVERFSFKRKEKIDIDTLSYNLSLKHFKNKKGKKKLMVIRDSFSDNLMLFLNNTFNEVSYIKHQNIDTKLIEKVKPDIVIIEIIERNLINLTRVNTP